MRRQAMMRLRYSTGLRQALKFAGVGLMNTALDLGLYAFLTRRVHWFAGENTLAKALSYSVGVVNSYLWNRAWTFNAADRSWRSFLPFVLTNLAGLAINAGVLHVGMFTFGIPETIVLVLATGIAFLWNFLINKRIVFKA
jgi:putative flippase GtrA